MSIIILSPCCAPSFLSTNTADMWHINNVFIRTISVFHTYICWNADLNCGRRLAALSFVTPPLSPPPADMKVRLETCNVSVLYCTNVNMVRSLWHVRMVSICRNTDCQHFTLATWLTAKWLLLVLEQCNNCLHCFQMRNDVTLFVSSTVQLVFKDVDAFSSSSYCSYWKTVII